MIFVHCVPARNSFVLSQETKDTTCEKVNMYTSTLREFSFTELYSECVFTDRCPRKTLVFDKEIQRQSDLLKCPQQLQEDIYNKRNCFLSTGCCYTILKCHILHF